MMKMLVKLYHRFFKNSYVGLVRVTLRFIQEPRMREIQCLGAWWKDCVSIQIKGWL